MLSAQVLDESEVDDLTLAFIQRLECAREHQPLVAVVESVWGRFIRFRSRRPDTERSSDVVFSYLKLACQLGRSRPATERRPQLGLAAHDPAPQLLHRSRHSYRPTLVPDMALDLADDVRNRKRGQLAPAPMVETVDRVDEPDRAGLEQVVVVAAALVATRERLDQREVQLDEPLARGDIAVLSIRLKQAACLTLLFGEAWLSARVFQRSRRPGRTDTKGTRSSISAKEPRSSPRRGSRAGACWGTCQRVSPHYARDFTPSSNRACTSQQLVPPAAELLGDRHSPRISPDRADGPRRAGARRDVHTLACRDESRRSRESNASAELDRCPGSGGGIWRRGRFEGGSAAPTPPPHPRILRRPGRRRLRSTDRDGGAALPGRQRPCGRWCGRPADRDCRRLTAGRSRSSGRRLPERGGRCAGAGRTAHAASHGVRPRCCRRPLRATNPSCGPVVPGEAQAPREWCRRCCIAEATAPADSGPTAAQPLGAPARRATAPVGRVARPPNSQPSP